jgi:hypothetical protein
MKPAIILEKIHAYSLYALVLLIPVWFLPITQDMLNFQKQTLLIVLTVLTINT